MRLNKTSLYLAFNLFLLIICMAGDVLDVMFWSLIDMVLEISFTWQDTINLFFPETEEADDVHA